MQSKCLGLGWAGVVALVTFASPPGALGVAFGAPLTAPTKRAAEGEVNASKSPMGEAVGRVISINGSAALDNRTLTLVRGARLYAGDAVRTGAGSAVRLLLTDQSILDIGGDARVVLAAVAVGERSRTVQLKLMVGRVWARVSSWFSAETTFEIETENAVCGVRGTEFVVSFDEQGKTSVAVVTGSVEMASLGGGAAELLGPLMAGIFGGSGGITVKKVSPGELERLAQDTSPKAALSTQELEQLEADYGSHALEPPAGGDPYLPPNIQVPAPPLESEPGVGRSGANIQVEIREDQ